MTPEEKYQEAVELINSLRGWAQDSASGEWADQIDTDTEWLIGYLDELLQDIRDLTYEKQWKPNSKKVLEDE